MRRCVSTTTSSMYIHCTFAAQWRARVTAFVYTCTCTQCVESTCTYTICRADSANTCMYMYMYIVYARSISGDFFDLFKGMAYVSAILLMHMENEEVRIHACVYKNKRTN